MRTSIALVVVMIGGTVFARGSGRAAFGPAGPGSRVRGGLSLHSGRHSGPSSFSFRFGGGACYSGGRLGFSHGGPGVYWPGRGSSGVSAYRGWTPCSPYLYRPSPGVYWQGLGPFEHTDAVIFHNAPGGQVFGYGPSTAGVAQPPPPPESARTPATPLIDRGDEAFGRGDFERAVALYREAVRKAPDDPVAALALGHGLFAVGAYAEAATALRRGIRLYPAILQVPMSRRDFYGDPEVFDVQLDRLERHVEANPNDAAARFLLGYNRYFGPRRATAAEPFQALGPADPEARLFLRELQRGP